MFNKIISFFQRKKLVQETHPDIPECRTAIHEAGHAVAAWASSSVEKIQSVTIVPDYIQDASGHVSFVQVGLHSEAYWQTLVIYLSGFAAEMFIYNKCHTGGPSRDLQKALKIVRYLAKNDFAPPEIKTKQTFDLAKAYSCKLNNKERLILNIAYNQSKLIIESFGYKFFKLVSLLLHKKTLNETDLIKLFGSRIAVNLIRKLFLTKFVLPSF